MGFKPITVNTPATDPAHILAQDDAILYHGIIGQDCVLDIGSKMEAVIIDNNTVRVLDGAVMVQGHLGHIPHGEYEDLHIENGVAGQKRHDLIVARFETTAGIDAYELAVIKGVPGIEGRDPDVTTGSLNAGDMLREYPLYRVKIDGLSLASVERVHTVGSTIGLLYQSLESHMADKTNPHNVTAAQLGAIIGQSGEKLKILFGGQNCPLEEGINSFDLTFPEAFSYTPRVFTNIHTNGPLKRASSAMAATTTGFQLNVENLTGSTSGVFVSWFAVGGA